MVYFLNYWRSDISLPAFATSVAKLLNFCINAGTWPLEWKLSDVTSVFKKGEVTSKNNYRPIIVLLLLLLLLLFEKVKFN